MKNMWAAIILAAIFILPQDIALAAATQSDSLVSQGSGLGGLFDQNFTKMVLGFIQIARVVVVAMTCIGLAMVMLGLESGNKTLWNWMLGAGLAVNFGGYILDNFVFPAASPGTSGVTPFVPDLQSSNDGKISVLGDFMTTYMQVINHGAATITPVCVRILLILAVAEASYSLAFKLISGDKIKYLLAVTIKIGMMIFVIENWVEGIGLMPALSQGFETMGLMMGGATAACEPDSIVANAIEMFAAFWDNAHLTSVGLFFVNVIALLMMIVVLFLTAIEMTMARIEFYTMALLVMPLLPFIITSKFSFLSDKAIGAMFNLAIKVMAIAFIGTVAGPFLSGFAKKVASTSNPWEQLGIVFQVLLASMMLYIIVKKISSLVAGILNGQPSLGGSDMTSSVRGAVGGAASAAGNVRGAAALASAAGYGAGASSRPGKYGALTIGALAELGKSAARNNAMTRGYRSGIQNTIQRNKIDRSSEIVKKASKEKEDIGKEK